MSKESVRALVAGLRTELGRAPDLDPNTREELHRLAHEVEAALHGSDASASPEEPALRDRLADRVRELEASHPKLSETVANIVDTLAFYNL
jgi:ElaB/YqjD/DUF883 family membrane-anchored ribosome-binding protein